MGENKYVPHQRFMSINSRKLFPSELYALRSELYELYSELYVLC